MEPIDALRSVETRLRLILTDRLGDRWLDRLPGGQQTRLATWRTNEANKRGTHVAGDNLVDYTMTGELGRIIMENWDSFNEVFIDQQEFEWLMRTVESVRNTIAHSRQLLPYERDLLSGAAGKMNQLVAAYRANAGNPDSFFPRIERITDSLGNDWTTERGEAPADRLDVGTRVLVQCSSTAVRGKTLTWQVYTRRDTPLDWVPKNTEPVLAGESESFEFSYEITEGDVSENFLLLVVLRTDSEYTRRSGAEGKFDDKRTLRYAVNPND